MVLPRSERAGGVFVFTGRIISSQTEPGVAKVSSYHTMKAILIDPWEKSLETIDLIEGKGSQVFCQLKEIYGLVGERGIDAAYIMPGESIIVGDHSSLQEPPLPSYSIHGYRHRLYGRGVVIGYTKSGEERETKLTVDDLSQLITWNPA